MAFFDAARACKHNAALMRPTRVANGVRARGVTRAVDILNEREGVWCCRTIFNCREACRREISITKAIGGVKKAMLKGSRDISVRQVSSPTLTGSIYAYFHASPCREPSVIRRIPPRELLSRRVIEGGVGDHRRCRKLPRYCRRPFTPESPLIEVSN